jgi:23S rRNA (adenine2503-C2)-methyltransferase
VPEVVIRLPLAPTGTAAEALPTPTNIEKLPALQAFTPEALVAAVPVITLRESRKIVSRVHHTPIGQAPLATPIPEVRRLAIDAVGRFGHVPTLTVVEEQASALDPFVKYLFRTHDGHAVEAVRIPLEKTGRFSVCVSSQVGCALGCVFCATGKLGLKRNLEAWEILEQIRIVGERLPAGGRVHGVVFQGMGEPLANADRVFQAISVLKEPSAMSVDARAITVTTSGLPAGIRRLASQEPKVRLGWSLGSALPEARKTLMPIAKTHALDEVFDAVVHHARTTGLSPLFAYTPLAGVNDDATHAEALAALVRRFEEASGRRPRVSVIPYNAIGADDPFTRTSPERENAFREILSALGAPTKKRYSGGSDVAAACGQLAGASMTPTLGD